MANIFILLDDKKFRGAQEQGDTDVTVQENTPGVVTIKIKHGGEEIFLMGSLGQAIDISNQLEHGLDEHWIASVQGLPGREPRSVPFWPPCSCPLNENHGGECGGPDCTCHRRGGE